MTNCSFVLFAASALAISAGLSAPASAQDRPDIAAETGKDDIIVTAQKLPPDPLAGSTRSDTPLLDTPMAVQIVPRSVIDDRQLRTALEAVKNVSGVQSSFYQFYDQYLIRGFDSGYGTTFRNGLQLRGITEAVNMAFVDRVEVVKGPASMLYGRIEPGGFVNVVTRKPSEQAAYSLDLQGGSWGMFRATAEATGKLTSDGSLLYRVTGDYDRSDSWVKNAHRDNKAVAASLLWKPNDRLIANLQLEHYDYKTTWLDASVPIIGDRPARVPRSFSIIYPQSWSDFPYTARRTLIAFEGSYAIDPHWKVSTRFHWVHSNEDQQGVYAANFDGSGSFLGVRFTHTGPNWIRATVAANLDLSGSFATGPITHKILIGGDWSRFTDDTPGSSGDIPGALPLDIFNPVYANYLPVLRSLAATDATNVIYADRSKVAGVYIQDEMTIGHLTLLLSGRYDWAQDAYADVYGSRGTACYPNCTARPITAYPTDKAFSPRAGLLYRLTDNASVYASYAKSFGSANGRDNLGNPLRPQVGTQYELGLKASLFHDGIIATASLFNLTKSNIPEYDPIDFFPHIVGEARSRGFEVDVTGRLNRHISVIAAYTYDDAVITKDAISGTQGNKLSGVAPHVGNVWAKYETTPDAERSWSFGAGIYASDARWGDDANTWRLPGYARIDGMVGYRTPIGSSRVLFQLNLNNILDATYFDHGGYGAAAYGAPRSVIGSVKASF